MKYYEVKEVFAFNEAKDVRYPEGVIIHVDSKLAERVNDNLKEKYPEGVLIELEIKDEKDVKVFVPKKDKDKDSDSKNKSSSKKGEDGATPPANPEENKNNN